jgi:hypothetical protein
MEPVGRQLDVLVDLALGDISRLSGNPLPYYSTNYEDAFQGAITANLFSHSRVLSYSDKTWIIYNPAEYTTYYATGATPAEAICRAIIKQREIMDRVEADVAKYRERQKTVDSKTAP